MSKVIMQQNL